MTFQTDKFGSFGGLNDENTTLEDSQIIILGIPFEGATSGKKGTSFAPSSLRLISKDMQTVSRGGIDIGSIKIKDIGDVQIFPLEGKENRESIKNSLRFLLENSKCPIIVIGGDHSITYPLVDVLGEKRKIGVIWFDAHRDLLEELSNSKYSHGTSLKRIVELDSVSTSNVLLVGTRYMTSEENLFVNENNINEIRMIDIEESNNPYDLFKNKVRELMNDVDYIHVSIDIDILDPAFAPGTGTPVGGGMTTSMLMKFLREIPLESKIRTVDMVEISPPLDLSGITIKVAMSILTEIIAKLSTIE